MTRVLKVQCDNTRCTTEVPVSNARCWYMVERRSADTHGELLEDVDSFDFCSLPCVSSWASARELVRAAS